MKQGIGLLFWGFFFVLIDINVMRIDLIPDFIGYFMVLTGVKKLEAQGLAFPRVRPILILLAILSIPGTIQWGTINLIDQGVQPTSLFHLGILSSLVFMSLHLMVGVGILQGLRKQALEMENQSLASKGQQGIYSYTVSTFLLLLIYPFVINTSLYVGTLLFIGIGIAYIIIQLIFLFFLRSFRISL
ncbi:MAG TPA: hypothetical protein DDY49_11920 [Paenibacillaceae bacterium]|nr:hypothetical protein [Paenibacillaceae bacterium]